MDKPIDTTERSTAPGMPTWECTRCEMEEEEFFQSPLQTGGYLPKCPKCGTNYRVFEVNVPTVTPGVVLK